MPPRFRAVLAALVTLACASALFAWMAGPVYAAEPGQCSPVAVIRATVGPAIAPAGGKIVTLTGAEAQAYLAVVNEAPPISTLAADGVLLVILPDAVTIGLIKGDVACVAVRIGLDTHARALDAARGHRA